MSQFHSGGHSGRPLCPIEEVALVEIHSGRRPELDFFQSGNHSGIGEKV
jgi:hypothetical protein